jgi:RNA polymerase primary sigma factor
LESVSEQPKSLLTLYLSDIRRHPLLSPEEERTVAARAKHGCSESRNRLVVSNLGFVVQVAKRYRNRGLPFEDLLNEGNLGLIEAAGRFDVASKTRFVTYAVWWIRKAILDALGKQTHLVRMPNSQARKAKRIQEAEGELRHTLGRRPERDELSNYLADPAEKIEEVLVQRLRPLSLEDKVGGEDAKRTVADVLADACGGPEDQYASEESKSCVDNALSRLDERERIILCHRYGIDDCAPRTLNELGRLLGLSRERVRQIEQQALRRLRRWIARANTGRPLRWDPDGKRSARRRNAA